MTSAKTKTFTAIKPADGLHYGAPIKEFNRGEVYGAIDAAHRVSEELRHISPAAHAALLRAIATSIESHRVDLIESACAETSLPEARIAGEITRTTMQFELFARLVESGKHLNVVIDKADPNYSPAPRPDIRKMNAPLGVVAIFAASNFPLAFSVAGGDAASAIAAGNAVVAKAHPSHPNTCATIELAIKDALKQCNLSPDLYSIVQGVNPEITHWLALHPSIQAIGFTGSETVGRILVNLGASREIPIPVFAEMGSLNPIFITHAALTERAEALANGIIDSALLGSGQFCTKPGLIFVPQNEPFIAAIKVALAGKSVGPLLSKSIADRYTSAISELTQLGYVEVISGESSETGFSVTPTVFITDWKTAEKNAHLLEEHFGPTTVIITTDESEFLSIADQIQGQLTASIHCGQDEDLTPLISALSHRVGRVIMNAYPTGVAVTSAMQHGGPWPSSSSHTTSVGVDAIYRFLRPVAYQGLDQMNLPFALQDSNPWEISQVING